MRMLFIGDVVGRSGRTIVAERLAGPDRANGSSICVLLNGENAAGGFGITEAIFNEFIEAGVDAVTLGNHAWDQREALVFIERAPKLIRPINYPAGTPGRGAAMIEARNGARVLVINAMGRIFMDPLDDPFAIIERELSACALKSGADAIVIDMHCEATSEKQAMGHFVDGRASLVVGTHTHAPTADHQILAGGTAFISDVGMTGDLRFHHRHGQGRAAVALPAPHPDRANSRPPTGPATLCAVAVETDDATGLATRIGAVRLGAAAGRGEAGILGLTLSPGCETISHKSVLSPAFDYGLKQCFAGIDEVAT